MDSIETYIQLVKQLLNDYAKITISNQADIYNEVIFDTEHNRYLLLSLGWSNGKRVYHTVIHIDIIDGQVWIQANNTDQLIAEELVELGIPAQSIVLGLQPPEVRPYTSYASSIEMVSP
ncbi:MAG: XisI protein [Symploca sp. SIO2D2]|nr:XisI protein [Symploca sp. SIO2D2]